MRFACRSLRLRGVARWALVPALVAWAQAPQPSASAAWPHRQPPQRAASRQALDPAQDAGRAREDPLRSLRAARHGRRRGHRQGDRRRHRARLAALRQRHHRPADGALDEGDGREEARPRPASCSTTWSRWRPTSPRRWNRRAYVYFMQNDVERALGDLRRTLALDPNHFKALDGLGQILREIGQKKAGAQGLQAAARRASLLVGCQAGGRRARARGRRPGHLSRPQAGGSTSIGTTLTNVRCHARCGAGEDSGWAAGQLEQHLKLPGELRCAFHIICGNHFSGTCPRRQDGSGFFHLRFIPGHKATSSRGDRRGPEKSQQRPMSGAKVQFPQSEPRRIQGRPAGSADQPSRGIGGEQYQGEIE